MYPTPTPNNAVPGALKYYAALKGLINCVHLDVWMILGIVSGVWHWVSVGGGRGVDQGVVC